jgi:hypothetical protein
VKKTSPVRKNNTESSKKDGRPKDDRVFMFEGKEYNTYSAMVEAKREQNKVFLEKTGLLKTAQRIKETEATEAQQRTLWACTELTTYTPMTSSVTLRPCSVSSFGQVRVDFEQMTKESYAKKQVRHNNNDEDSDYKQGSDTETEGEDKKCYISRCQITNEFIL